MYKPNYNNATTQATVLRVINWLERYVGKDSNICLNSKILRSPAAFGNSNLGSYLRNYVLIKTNPTYKPGKFSQQYRINIDRLNKLRARVGLEPSLLIQHSIEKRFSQQAQAIDQGLFEYTKSGGRAYNGLQNIAKDIKLFEFAARGYIYDYDVEACAPTLFLQTAQKIKPQMKSLDYIEFYLKHKNLVRDELCIKYNLSSKQIKQIINGMFQGGVLNTYWDNKIFVYLNRNVYKMNQFKQDGFIKALHADIKTLWKILREDVKITLNTDFTRLNGLYKSNYYKILEGQIMAPVWKYLKKQKIKHFREHDGFKSDRFVIPDDLALAVKIHTGYEVKFSYSMFTTKD